jgi:periplasmic protein TonB
MRQTALGDTDGDRQRLDIVPARHDAPAGDGVPNAANAPVIVATNVVPFTRARRETQAVDDAATVSLDPAGRPAPYWPARDRRILALLILSLLIHGGLYYVFNRPAEPMISIGVEAISVELVPGTNSPAGMAAAPGEQQAQTAPEPEQKREDETAKVEDQPPPVEEAKPVEDQPPPTDLAAVEPKQEPVVETPPEPEKAVTLPADEPLETHAPKVAAVPPEPMPVEPEPPKSQTKPEVKPQPVQHREPKPKQPAAHPKADRQKTASREAERPGSRTSAAGGTGPGRSQSYSNWIGLVYAHLARYQRANQANQGLVVVRFSLDASGSVRSVSVARSSGFANLDAEAQAAVRRASPFPPPPLGTSSVTAPIRYRSAS